MISNVAPETNNKAATLPRRKTSRAEIQLMPPQYVEIFDNFTFYLVTLLIIQFLLDSHLKISKLKWNILLISPQLIIKPKLLYRFLLLCLLSEYFFAD